MTNSEWIEIRDGLERCLRIVNTSPRNIGDGKDQSELRTELRTQLTKLIFYTEGIIEGREVFDRH